MKIHQLSPSESNRFNECLASYARVLHRQFGVNVTLKAEDVEAIAATDKEVAGMIFHAVADFFNCNVTDLQSLSRVPELSLPRKFFYHAATNYTALTPDEIGEMVDRSGYLVNQQLSKLEDLLSSTPRIVAQWNAFFDVLVKRMETVQPIGKPLTNSNQNAAVTA